MYCWHGNVVNGACSECGKKASAQRREDALPYFHTLHNRYTVGEILGNGGFGITYSAYDNVDRKVVAIKELFPKDDVSRDMRSMRVTVRQGQEALFGKLADSFVNEAILLQSIGKMPGLTEMYNVFSENNTFYYAMEYLRGCTLQRYLEEHGPMTWEVLNPLFRKILMSLYSLHKLNLIHRDISPDNLFLTDSGEMYLIDFGSVRTYSGAKTFTVFVKHQFSPWEQYQCHGKQGPWTDIYSLSVCVYFLLTGHLPQTATDRFEHDNTPPLSTCCPSLPGNIAGAIEKGMSIRVEDRYQSIPEFMNALYPQALPTSREIVCRAGIYEGMRIRIDCGSSIIFGRNRDSDVCFPDDTPGVSRRQCVLYFHKNGALYVKDLESSFGTYMNGGELTREWTRLPDGSTFGFGNERFTAEP